MRNFMLILAASAMLASCGNEAKTSEATATTPADTASMSATPVAIDTTRATDEVEEVAPATMRAKYVDFEFGDLPHFVFEDEKGKRWSFVGMEEKSVKFYVELSRKETNETNQGLGINPKLVGKMFDLKTGTSKIAEYVDGPLKDMPTVLEAKMVK